MKYFRLVMVLVLFSLVACGDLTPSPVPASSPAPSSLPDTLAASPTAPALTSPTAPLTTTAATTPALATTSVATGRVFYDGTTAPPATAALKNNTNSNNFCTFPQADDPGIGNLASRCVTAPQPGHSTTVRALGYSPDGQLFASSGEYPENSVKLWQAADGKLLQTFYLEAGFYPDRLWFSPDSAQLFAATTNHFPGQRFFVYGWDIVTRQVIRKIAPMSGDYGQIFISPDLKTIVTIKPYSSPVFSVWDAATGKQIGSNEMNGVVLEAAFSPDSKIFAIGGDFSHVTLWERDTLKQVGDLAHSTRGFSLEFSPDGKKLLVGDPSANGFFELWDIPGQQKVTTIGALGFSPTNNFTPDSQNLAVFNSGAILFKSTATGQLNKQLPAQTGEISALAFSPDGKKLLTGAKTPDAALTVWDLTGDDSKAILTIKGTSAPPYSVAVSADGRRLAVGQLGTTVMIGDFDTSPQASQGLLTLDPQYPGQPVTALSPDGKFLAIAGGFGGIRLWDLAAGKELGNFGKVFQMVTSLRFSPDSRVLAVSGSTGLLELFTVEPTGLRDKATLLEEPSYPITAPYQPVYQVAFSLNGKLLGAASAGGTVKIWNLQDPKTPLVRTFDKHSVPVRSLAFSRDGQLVASGDEAGNIKIWESATGQEKFNIRQPGEPVNFLGFSKNENFIIATTETGRLKMWDLKVNPPQSYSTKDELFGAGIRQAELTRDSRTLVTIHGDGAIRTWEPIG